MKIVDFEDGRVRELLQDVDLSQDVLTLVASLQHDLDGARLSRLLQAAAEHDTILASAGK